jgi:probable H4MPT-linked C1 transfer pathway protein
MAGPRPGIQELASNIQTLVEHSPMVVRNKMTSIIGWDLGGANLKLARVEDGRVVQVAHVPCPIIQDRSKFDAALGEARKLCPSGARHAVTMTGELSDVFADRAEGVAYLVAMMRKATGDGTRFYGARAGFLNSEQATERYLAVASANWHASAALAATKCCDGLFVDAGTTTTDIIPLKAGLPAARGYTDAKRLAEGELIYAGVVRTPVMAMARGVPFKGRAQRIAAERFATMADVWRLASLRCRSLSDSGSPREKRRGERGASRAHAWPRLGRRRAFRLDRGCALSRRASACRDRSSGERAHLARRAKVRGASDWRGLRAFHCEPRCAKARARPPGFWRFD